MRILNFFDGYTSETEPDDSGPSDPSTPGVVTVTGSLGSPVLVTAAGGITPQNVAEEYIFVAGNASPITVTKNPQIAAGTVVGQKLSLIFCDATNTVKLQTGTGLKLAGTVTGGADADILKTIWDGSVWREEGRV